MLYTATCVAAPLRGSVARWHTGGRCPGPHSRPSHFPGPCSHDKRSSTATNPSIPRAQSRSTLLRWRMLFGRMKARAGLDALSGRAADEGCLKRHPQVIKTRWIHSAPKQLRPQSSPFGSVELLAEFAAPAEFVADFIDTAIDMTIGFGLWPQLMRTAIHPGASPFACPWVSSLPLEKRDETSGGSPRRSSNATVLYSTHNEALPCVLTR